MADRLELWRVFPWDRSAAPGDAYSPSFIRPPSGRGRFDLPREQSSVLYVAESAEHAVGEALQPWRGQRVSTGVLKRRGLPLSLVSVTLDGASRPELADLCNPEALARLGLAPDRVASRHRWITQPLSRTLWTRGFGGLRWWSSFWGDWHTVVLFVARLRGRLLFGKPRMLEPDSAPVVDAVGLLGIELD
jgi:hypothetical protein